MSVFKSKQKVLIVSVFGFRCPYSQSVESHLRPYIRAQGDIETLAGFMEETPPGCFVTNTRALFEKNASMGPFSESRLRECYLNYAIEGMHKKFTIINLRTGCSKGVSSEEKIAHCEGLQTALLSAVQRDFEGSSVSDLDPEYLRKKIELWLNLIYDEETKNLTQLLVNQKIQDLRNTCVHASQIPRSEDVRADVLGEIQDRFTHDQYKHVSYKLLTSVRPKVEFLKLEIRAYALLQVGFDSYNEYESVLGLPSEQELVEKFCSAVLKDCSPDQHEELIFLLQARAGVFLDSLRSSNQREVPELSQSFD